MTKDRKDGEHKMKLSDVVLAAQADPVWDEADKLGLDPEGIVSALKDKYSRYSDSACIKMAIAELKKYLKENSTEYEEMSGMVLGGMDVYGKKAPITYPCISKDGKKIVKISTWDKSLLKVPARVTVSGEFSPSFGNLIIDTVKEQEVIDPEGIAAKLAKVALTVDDELDALEQYGCVIIRGKIKYVRPSTRWVNGEQDGAWSTWEKTEGKNGVFQPVIDLSLDPGDTNTYVTLQLKRQHSANPVINVEDLALACEDAAKDYPDQPKKQGESICAAICGREVVALGSVNSVSKKWNEKLNAYATSLNVAICYVEELPVDAPARPKETLEGVGTNEPKVPTNPKKVKEAEKTQTEAPPAEKKTEKTKKTREEKVKDAGLEKPAEGITPQEERDIKNSFNLSATSPDFKETVHNIVALCKITKRTPDSFSEKELQETLKLKMGDVTIKAAKKRAADMLGESESNE
jgi:hypothetical protein